MYAIMTMPTYAINLKSRPDRKEHILNEFSGRDEFELNIVEACEHERGATGLWNSITNVLQNLVKDDDEFIILCEDDHKFTEDYSREYLFACIREAQEKGADILSGGVSWCRDAVQVTENLFWVEKFTGLQFTLIFRRFFQTILEASFGDNDVADYKISTLSNNKLFMYPFVSGQRDFGYSDVTAKNNLKGRVDELFKNSSERIQSFKNVSLFYKAIPKKAYEVCNNNDKYESITIPTYIINLPERTDRLAHIEDQFFGKSEFDVTIIPACRHEIGAVGLWQSILSCIKIAKENDDDVMIICEDDHTFTENYSKDFLIQNILEAHEQGCDLLSGGIGGFNGILPVTTHRYWVGTFWCTQFVVLYRRFFDVILSEPFADTDTADGKFSEMTSHKMVLYPFISVQKDFGYSDVTRKNNEVKGLITNHFNDTERRLKTVYDISKYLETV